MDLGETGAETDAFEGAKELVEREEEDGVEGSLESAAKAAKNEAAGDEAWRELGGRGVF